MSKKRRKKSNHVGEIYQVDPEHVVKKKDMAEYINVKGKKANNKRPVMVSVQRSGKRVQVSEMTSKTTTEHIKRKQKVKLEKTYPKKESYVQTNTIGKSRKTNKPFTIGKDPLINKQKKKVHIDDLEEFKKARKARGR